MRIPRALVVVLLIVNVVPAWAQTLRIDDQVFLVSPSTLAGPAGAFIPDVTLWPDGILPVVFPEDITTRQRGMFFAACATWSEVADVRCVERTDERDYVTLYIAGAMGCWATVGAGASITGLAPMCWAQSVLVHELGHLFGLQHEHQRSDRDAYVLVNYDNAEEPYRAALAPIASAKTGAYDFLSIMHYAQTAFSRAPYNLPTVTPTPPYRGWERVMGRGEYPSFEDGVTMRKLYGGAPRPARPRLAILSPSGQRHVTLAWAADPIAGPATYTIIARRWPSEEVVAVMPMGHVTSISAVSPFMVTVRIRATYANRSSVESNEIVVF